MQLNPGDKFMLDPSTPAIYVGPGGCRTCDTVPLMMGDEPIGASVQQLTFHPVDGGEVISYWYKAKWRQIPAAAAERDWPRDTWVAGWSSAAEQAVLSQARWIDEAETDESYRARLVECFGVGVFWAESIRDARSADLDTIGAHFKCPQR